MPEHDGPPELRAIAEECSSFTSAYPSEKAPDLMMTVHTCDMCQSWNNGYCDIFLREKYGSSIGEFPRRS